MTAQLAHDHRDFELYYAVRSAEDAAYAEELARSYGRRIHVFHSDRGQRIPLDQVLGHQPLGTHLYVCGPARMIDWAVELAHEAGWPDQSIHQERFIAPATGDPYAVRLARSALDVIVGAHQSMLEAIEAAGVQAPYFCRGGACGRCETTVLDADGALLHADHFLTDADRASGKKIMLCVSRFEGARLVLDL
jgi:ferredoxin